MPIHADELSRFFDSLYSEVRKQWERAVDRGAISEWSMQQKEIRADEIGMILRALGEGHAVLTYRQRPQREPSPPIFVLPRVNVED